MSRRRVVITGSGVTSSIGLSVSESVAALKEGRGGIRYMHEWDDIAEMQCRLGGPVKGLELKLLYPRKRRRTMGRVAMLAVHAAEQAVAQSGLDESALHSERMGVSFGSTSGSADETEMFSKSLTIDRTMRGLDSNAYFKIMTHTCAVNVAQFFGVQGRIASTCTACTSGAQGIGRAYELIRYGQQDAMIAGGAEEIHYTSAVTFDLLMATSIAHNKQPTLTPRPFDRDRDGLVVGEGGGALVLESLEHARARDAHILGEVLGYASNCDGAHITAPRQEGMKRVMELALADAELGIDAVDYINAHGTGTETGDLAETQATASLFGNSTPFSGVKGFVGHTLGACGAMEAAWCLDMMNEGWLAACKNLDNVDPRCGDLDYITSIRDERPQTVMSNNFAFGGINTSLLIGKAP